MYRTRQDQFARAEEQGKPCRANREQRDGDELLGFRGTRIAAPGVTAYNPVFDVTPANLIDAIVTEKGVVHNPNITGMKALFG